MIVISVGVILGFALQFFIPIQIMFPSIQSNFALADRHPLGSEMAFRVVVIMMTFSVALLVPNLGLLISLIGAVCSTSLALVFPVLIEYLVATRNGAPIRFASGSRMLFILMLGVAGFISGGFESIKQIIELYGL